MSARANSSNVVEAILGAYGLKYRSVLPPQKGYRNQSFPVILDDGKVINLILYKREPDILAKIKAANSVSSYLARHNVPVRHTIDSRVIKMRSGKMVKYAALYSYLEGDTIPWESYTQDHIKILGKTMSDMHATLTGYAYNDLNDVIDEYLAINTRMKRYFSDALIQWAIANKLMLRIRPEIFDQFNELLNRCHFLPGAQPLHMDFVRSNILFADEPDGEEFKVSVAGILDFEKASYGHPLFDVARTLAFLMVDCKYKDPVKVRKYFLGSGYIKRGKADLDAEHIALITPLVELFLFYDFYKFLRHNPYESLPENQHFVRTVEFMLPRMLVVPTTPVVT